jgi:cell wall-associated NlpC family hydrolase
LTWWNDYIELPFVPFGRGLEGCDCWGLVLIVYRDVFGIAVPSYVGAYSSPDNWRDVSGLIRENSPEWIRIEPGQEQSGDVVVFTRSAFPFHVGLVTTPGSMLHISKGINSTVEQYTTAMWNRRIEGIYRHADR